MPCFDDQAYEADKKAHQDAKKLTQMLCAVMTAAEQLGYTDNLLAANVGQKNLDLRAIRNWWERHKEEDRKRGS